MSGVDPGVAEGTYDDFQGSMESGEDENQGASAEGPFLAGPGESDGLRDAIAVPQSRGRWGAGGTGGRRLWCNCQRDATAIDTVGETTATV